MYQTFRNRTYKQLTTEEIELIGKRLADEHKAKVVDKDNKQLEQQIHKRKMNTVVSLAKKFGIAPKPRLKESFIYTDFAKTILQKQDDLVTACSKFIEEQFYKCQVAN